jgi:hypothetical protein
VAVLLASEGGWRHPPSLRELGAPANSVEVAHESIVGAETRWRADCDERSAVTHAWANGSFLAAGLAVALLSSAGCLVGDEGDEGDDAVGALAKRGNPANTLRWGSFSSPCIAPGAGYATNGGSLSAFYDDPHVSTCTTTGIVYVPAGVRLTTLHQFVMGDGTSTVQYTATLGGSRVTSRAVAMPRGLETTASVSAFGAQLCARAGTAPRAVKFSYTVAASLGAYLDSVDWEFGAETCEE